MNKVKLPKNKDNLMGFLKLDKTISVSGTFLIMFLFLAIHFIQRRKDYGCKEASIENTNRETMECMPPQKKCLPENIETEQTNGE